VNNPTTKGGPLRSSSRDLVRLTCPSCDDEIRVPADEVRPKCERCSVLLLDVERPVCPRPHEFAVTELIVRMRDEERHLFPVPGGYEVN